MKSYVAIKAKLPYDERIVKTMRQYSRAAQRVINVGFAKRVHNKRKLHNLTYREIRSLTQLPAQLVCSSRDLASECLKAVFRKKGSKPKLKKLYGIRYDARSFWFKDGVVSIVTVEGRIKLPVEVPKYFVKYLGRKVCSAIVFERNGELFIHIIVCTEITVPVKTDAMIVGVDLGITNIAVTSEAQFFKGVESRRAKYQRLRKVLQSKGTRSAKRKLKRISGREKRFMADVNHCISKAIVSGLEAGDFIVMEELRGVREQKRGKALNKLLHDWSFYQLQTFIEYKAIEQVIVVIKVSAAYTSQSCSRCGEINSIRPKNGGFFKCLHCGYSCNADLNASFNLKERLKPLVNSLGLSVNQPIVASL